MKVSKTKVGRYPLQRTASEFRDGQYESVDYLYSHPAGFVWLRTVHDIPGREHRLALEFIWQGVKFQTWHPPLAVAYSPRRLCRLARQLAEEHSRK